MRNAPPMPRDELMTATEALDLLGIDRSTLSRWVGAGRLKPKLGGGRGSAFVFARRDVVRLAEERAAERKTKGPDDAAAPEALADAGSAGGALLLIAAATVGAVLAVGPGIVGLARTGMYLVAAVAVGVPLVIAGAFVRDVVRDAAAGAVTAVRTRHRAGMARLREHEVRVAAAVERHPAGSAR